MRDIHTIGISRLAYRLPAHRQTLDELAAAGRLASRPETLREFGFSTCYEAERGEELENLLLASGQEVLQDGDAVRERVEALFLYSGLSSSTPTPEPGDQLSLFRYPIGRAQFELNLGAVATMALSQRGCCGLLAAINMAAKLLHPAVTPDKDSILVLAADALPPGGKREIIYNLMSDAASALLVERNSQHNRIVHYHEQSQPYYWDTAQRENELLAAYFPMAQRVIAGALEGAGLRVEDVRWFVPHNVSLRSWHILARLLTIPEEKIWTDNIPRIGHTVSCDHVINLVDMEQAGLLTSGDYLVLFTFGFGASWSCLILQH